MPTNVLTDARCRSAKPAERDYKLFDGGGLYLFVSAKGAKTWRIAFRVGGKQKTLSFGAYPQVSLAQAREQRDALKADLRTGSDPAAARRAKRTSPRFDEAVTTYWGGRSDISPSYRANALAALESHLYPQLGHLPIGLITRDDMLAALNVMDQRGLHEYVRKVRMWASQVFDWAIEQRYAAANPAKSIDPRRAFAKRAVEHFAAVELRDVPELLQRVALEPRVQSVLALRLLALTWTRTVELRMALWEEIDLGRGEWIIPAGKMKRKRDHVVPLSRQALELLAELKPRARGSAYVFPGDRSTARPMSENSVLYLLHRIGYKGRMTGHGFRSVASTWANTHGYNPDAIERQLAHVPENRVRAAYNRAAYLVERRQMLQAWADWLDECEAGAESSQG